MRDNINSKKLVFVKTDRKILIYNIDSRSILKLKKGNDIKCTLIMT